MVDHKHSQVLLVSLKQLIDRNDNIIFEKVCNSLNDVYKEGERAQREGDFAEDKQAIGFNCACDRCCVEIETLQYICMGCRQLILCEDCYDEHIEYLERIQTIK